jgi:(R,R)-butanediol dehydrogenase/meso-butanediol dehydrogenase/diacetyl reductase
MKAISEIGEGVTGLAKGTTSSSSPILWTATATCARPAATTCAGSWASSGWQAAGGGLSEEIVADERWVHPIGDIPLDEAALIEPLSVAHHAVACSGVKAGDTALVGGSGPIGLLTAAVLKGMGVTTIISELTTARKE